jgi:uncharacterized membrane protein YgcG
MSMLPCLCFPCYHAVQAVQPDSVIVELCRSRTAIMAGDYQPAAQQAPSNGGHVLYPAEDRVSVDGDGAVGSASISSTIRQYADAADAGSGYDSDTDPARTGNNGANSNGAGSSSSSNGTGGVNPLSMSGGGSSSQGGGFLATVQRRYA